MRLLMVENHALFANVVSREFLAGHEVEVVASLDAARQRLTDARFDAVLVDFDLDDGKGDVLVEELAQARFTGRIIGISSHPRGNAALLAAGAHSVCPKIRFREITSVLGAQ